MNRNDIWVIFLLFVAASLLVIGLIWSAQPAKAQCGSSASSCKTCHETQGQDPVNTEGAWRLSATYDPVSLSAVACLS